MCGRKRVDGRTNLHSVWRTINRYRLSNTSILLRFASLKLLASSHELHDIAFSCEYKSYKHHTRFLHVSGTLLQSHEHKHIEKHLDHSIREETAQHPQEQEHKIKAKPVRLESGLWRYIPAAAPDIARTLTCREGMLTMAPLKKAVSHLPGPRRVNAGCRPWQVCDAQAISLSLSLSAGYREIRCTHTHTDTLSPCGKVCPPHFPVSSKAMDYYQAVDSVLDLGSVLANVTNTTTTTTSVGMFNQMSPYFFGFLGAAIAISISVIGAAWCVLNTSLEICSGFSVSTQQRLGKKLFQPPHLSFILHRSCSTCF